MMNKANEKEKAQKIGILTFHWADDFGAMLQAYGLKSALSEIGYKSEIVPYSNVNLSGRYWLIKWVGRRTKPDRFRDNFDKLTTKNNFKNILHFLKKRRLMKNFRIRYLTRRPWRNLRLFLNTTKYDGLVIGSDQVWNPEITVGIDDMYFGQFNTKKDAKVVSYAASIGKERLNNEDGIMIGSLIDENFDSVSVREKSSIAFLREFCKSEINDMPDPTLLCKRESWSKLANSLDIDKPFVFVYSTEINKSLFEFAQDLCDRFSLILINGRELAIGPSEFLWLVDNANYVVTNSFHCTVFSIIYHKQFFAFKHSNKNARLKDLLENTGLNNRISDIFCEESLPKEPDWDAVDSRLDMLRSKGTDFLRESFSEGE